MATVLIVEDQEQILTLAQSPVPAHARRYTQPMY
jgi:hypothetical protein